MPGLLNMNQGLGPGLLNGGQLPRVPWSQNPMVTTAALSLLGGRTLNDGLANVAQSAPYGMQAKSSMQQFMLAQQEKQQEKAEADARRNATNEVLKNWPGIPEHLRSYYLANPEQFGDYVKSTEVGGAGEYGLTPVPGVDAEGNAVLLQMGKNGIATKARLPDGVSISKEPIRLDAGTHYVLLDPITRQPVGQVAKNLEGQKSAEVQGTRQGEAVANLPLAEAAADRIIRSIDDVLNDPGLSRITGPIQSWLPNLTGEANRAQSKLDQILGGTFLQAYNDLRGGGQITEKEGEKATAAYNRLTTTGMDDADYRDALKEFRTEVLKLVDIARRKAGAAGSASPPPAASPAAGTYEWTPDGGLRPAQ